MTLRKLRASRSAAVITQTKEAPTGAPNDVTAFIALIERVARDPSIDIDKLDRLLMMREKQNSRLAEQAFSVALAAAQEEMQPVVADANNQQTRSRYASLAALDRAVRPIYTRHGFSLTFTTEDAAAPEQIRVLCDVAHVEGHCRRYRLDVPCDGKGARGNDVQTKVHALGSAVTYAQRYITRLAFNLSTCHDDDDGNAAGYRTRAAGQGASISERAVAARVSQAWQGQRTQPFFAGEAGMRHHQDGMPSNNQASMPSSPDADISGRRAAVQLRNALPQPAYVIEPPKRRLDRELNKQRHTGNHWEAKIKAEQRREGRFRQPIPNLPNRQVYDERHPPPDDDIPEFQDRRHR